MDTNNQHASFWLPSHFLSDDLTPHPTLTLDDTSLLSHSTHPKSESTLSGCSCNRSGFTSPNGPSRVPLTPEFQNDAAWELLYEAARLKMNAIAAQLNNRGLLGTPRQQWGQERACQSAWPPLTATRQQPRYNKTERVVYQGGPGVRGVKRESVGTGVFLPRVSTSPPRHQYQYQPAQHHPEYRRKSPVFVPTRASNNMDFEEVNLKSYSGNGPTGFSTDHEHMMAVRNAILAQQRRNMTRTDNNKGATAYVGQGLGLGPGHEIRLPTDWTY